MYRILRFSVAGFLVAALGCYHATIDTGLAPSTTVVEKAWAPAWVYGLVPPATLETQAQCKSGVSKVETQLSFLNQLVSGLTAGIFTPMSIKVTCAQAGHASVSPTAPQINVGANATKEQMQSAINRAVHLSLRTGEPVYLVY